MDENTRYFVEAINAKDERIISRLVKIIVVLIVAWFLSIAGLLWYCSLPAEEVHIENEDGNANYVGNDLTGDINNGENYSKEKSNT